MLYTNHTLRDFNKKIVQGETVYLVKLENYKEPTWEPSKNIPQFITNYYEKTGRNKIPTARVKSTKVVGMT